MSMRRPDNATVRVERFIQELGFLLQEYKDLDFVRLTRRTHQSSREFDEFIPDNPNIQFLIGCLPALFQSESIFPKNEDLAKFCQDNIGISLVRYHKKARRELIGIIVCEIATLDDRALEKFTTAMKRVIGNLRQSPSKSFFEEWNEVIKSTKG